MFKVGDWVVRHPDFRNHSTWIRRCASHYRILPDGPIQVVCDYGLELSFGHDAGRWDSARFIKVVKTLNPDDWL